MFSLFTCIACLSDMFTICCSSLFNRDWYFFLVLSRSWTNVLEMNLYMYISCNVRISPVIKVISYALAFLTSLTSSADCWLRSSALEVTRSSAPVNSWIFSWSLFSRTVNSSPSAPSTKGRDFSPDASELDPCQWKRFFKNDTNHSNFDIQKTYGGV